MQFNVKFGLLEIAVKSDKKVYSMSNSRKLTARWVGEGVIGLPSENKQNYLNLLLYYSYLYFSPPYPEVQQAGIPAWVHGS